MYIPVLKLAIEFGAWFWHKDKIKDDNKKQRLCKDNGIHLITILEYCPDGISKKLVGDYRIYLNKLSDEKDYHTTKELLFEIFNEYVSRKNMPEAEKKHSGSMFNKKSSSSNENICDTHIDGA